MKLSTYTIVANDFTHAGFASSELKKWARRQNFDPNFIRRFAIACYEAEINAIIHSVGGEVILDIDEHHINLIFQDHGPGIKDIDLAMKEGWSSASETAQAMGFGAGLGLPNIKKNVDTFKIESCYEGTRLTLGFNNPGVHHETQ